MAINYIPLTGKPFSKNLPFGKQGESEIALWVRYRGSHVLPVYEKELNEGKGPQLFLSSGELIAPDMLVFNSNNLKACWIEAKHKSVFSWHRITEKWVTGIDIRHYNNYLELLELSPWPIWLLFLHKEDRCEIRGEPYPCPVGLFGNTLEYLKNNVNHRHTNWGKSGMVYWAYSSLKLLATLGEVQEAVKALSGSSLIRED
jgi:hypothetical protein